MYPKLIESVIHSRLDHFEALFLSEWFVENRDKIDTEVEDAIKEEIKNELSKSTPGWAANQPFMVPNKNQKLVNINGHLVDEDEYNSFQNVQASNVRNRVKSNIKNQVRAKYNDIFYQTYWPTLSQAIKKEIQSLKPEEILKNYLTRHPWLDEELQLGLVNYNGTLTYSFLNAVISTHLESLKTTVQPSAWNWDLIGKIYHGTAKWPALNAAQLANDIEGYPLSDIQTHYAFGTPYLQNLNNLTFDVVHGSIPPQHFLNYSFRRLDIFRYLHKHLPSETQSNLIEGIDTTQVAPFHISELQHLSLERLKFIKNMIVNLGDENAPIWVAFNKPIANNPKEWDIYIPESNVIALQPAIEAKLTAFKNKGITVNYKQIDYRLNAQQNDIQSMSAISTWHSVLFGRVFHWLNLTPASSRPPLSEYRENIPLTVLFAFTLKSMLPTYSYSESKKSIDEVFARRQPFSDAKIDEYLVKSKRSKINYLLDNPDFFDDHQRELSILIAIDKGEINLYGAQQDVVPDTIELPQKSDSDQLKQSLFLIYPNENFNRLVIPAIPKDSMNANHTTLANLLDYNLSLTSVIPTSPNQLKQSSNFLTWGMECTARNRFLMNVLDSTSWKNITEQRYRKELWKRTALELVNFYNNAQEEINLDFVNNYLTQTTTWKSVYFDPQLCKPTDPKLQTTWSLAQIAQMGTRGLDQLFQHLRDGYTRAWNNTYKTPAPNLPAIFDLSGSLNQEPQAYTSHLASKIRELYSRPNSCSPLFKSLSFILPPSVSSIQNSLQEIFEATNSQKALYSDAVGEISLYNLDISNYKEAKNFLDEIEKLTLKSQNPLMVMIHIPGWDREAYTSIQDRELKAQYKKIQNQILENQRQFKFPQLTANTKNIHLLVEGKITPALVIEEQVVIKPQPWDDDKDVLYPLTSVTPGIQQQLQQAIEQEYTMEQQVAQELEQEAEQIIADYKGNESLLITRANIDTDASCQEIWAGIPANIKEFSGWDKSNLTQLFSLWVGSKLDAEHVIKKMEPAAVEKIMENASSFRFGASRDNLPAGFYLAYSRLDKGLILCYNKEREVQDLIARADKKFEERNPFTVQFYTPRKPHTFRGDYRQFSPISTLVPTQKLLWNYIATDEQDQQHLDKVLVALQNLGVATTNQTAPVHMQEYTVLGSTQEYQATLDACRLELNNWAKAKLKGSNDVLTAMFDPSKPTVFTENNLKAFGQLFYDHEVNTLAKNQKNASDHFLVLAQQIYQAFGENHFATWKTYFIDPSQNLSECLAKDEIDTVALSIVTLKNNKALQNIWWALIAAHGKSTGFTRYAPLWFSFQRLLECVDKFELKLNEQSMLDYLNQVSDFQGQVFLDRLYFTLLNSKKEMSKKDIQQNILNNIHQIDWKHNGFYYASRYEKYPYWAESLDLTGFNASVNANVPSYLPKGDVQHQPTALVYNSLRLLSQKVRVEINDFHKLQNLINEHFVKTNLIQTKNGALTLRLLVACLALGSDRVAELSNDVINEQIRGLQNLPSDILEWLNKNLELDRNIVSGSLHLRFEHVSALANAIQNSGMKNKILSLPLTKALPFINDSGRALQCYSSNYAMGFKNAVISNGKPFNESALTLLYQTMDKNNFPFEHALLRSCPWLLLTSPNKVYNPFSATNSTEQEILHQQLRSIDFGRSTYLPTDQELSNISRSIATSFSNTAKQNRQKFVEQQIAYGCRITYQDASYRQLSKDEKAYAELYLNKHLKVNFKSQNIILCTKLLDECLAVSIEGTAQKTKLENFLKLLVHIDNKPYYNDLGQVIGLLIAKSKTQAGQKFYSLEQLHSYLECIINPQDDENVHYPINTLMEVLDSQEANAPNASLLNENLNKLKPSISSLSLKNSLIDIVQSDLPGQYKPVLVKYAFKFTQDSFFINQTTQILQKLHSAKVEDQWLNEVIGFIKNITAETDIYSNLYSLRNTILRETAYMTGEVNLPADKSWEKHWVESQTRYIDIVQRQDIEYAFLQQLNLNNKPQDAYIRMIVLKAIDLDKLNFSKDKVNINSLYTQLKKLNEKELRELAHYCYSSLSPSVDLLRKLTSPGKFNSTAQLIHQYEVVEQAKNPDGSSKRKYSVTPQDKNDLARVFRGLKQKGQGYIADAEQKQLLELLYYTNAYSQVAQLENIDFEQLKNQILYHRNTLLNETTNVEERNFASARLLACMREVLLRKTGKWVNHTQMLDLLYAAKYNEESLLHQVKTGQGKSIISLMRVAYSALQGNVVDLFSSKDSLSKRDQEEFSHVLHAMGIRNSYITPNSPADDYQTNDSRKKIGAVNFFTIGNASLFQSTQIWQHIKNIKLDPQLRVAFADECDFVLKFENTQFNYSANNGAESIYNFDEWVYRVVYQYYKANVDKLPIKEGTKYLSRNVHLKEICDLLLQQEKNSPKQSEFLQKYVHPAADGDPQAIEMRDNILKKMIFAAHAAQGLKEGEHYCVRPEQEVVGQRTIINTRFAKVLIGNQIKHGSTYSELVQQFLHVRLNEEAVAKGESPDFFIEPDSTIALSSNAKYDLKKYYHKIEGCTGTAGNQTDLQLYEKEFNIKHVVKLPTHEQSRTAYLETIYAKDEEDHIKNIVDTLLTYRGKHPILMTCEDDIEVKRISRLVELELKNRGQFNADNFIVDTNDSGLSESDILPRTGAPGRITISSRMGRGTDIKPETPEGLFVLRTYPTLPQIVKQENGRGGRNGQKGTCIDIIDYSRVLADYHRFTSKTSPNKNRFEKIMEEQGNHLEDKLEKHEMLGSEKWKWLNDPEKREKYLITRSVQQLKYELKKQSETYLRRKEFLIATLSGNVVDVLKTNFTRQNFDQKSFKKSWLECNQKIEAFWNIRLAGKKGDNDEVYQEFLKNAAEAWKSFATRFMDLNADLFEDNAKSITKNIGKLESNKKEDVIKFIAEQTDILNTQKAQGMPLTAAARIALEAIKAQLKKTVFLTYHPDKNTDPDAAAIFTDAHTLYDLVEERLNLNAQQQDETKYDGANAQANNGKGNENNALVVRKRPKPQVPAQNPEFEAVISFYQSWVDGAAKYYFAKDANAPVESFLDIFSAIYGGGIEDLNKFFSKAYQTSCTKAGKAVQEFFQRMAAQPKNSLHQIPLANLKKNFKLFSAKFSDTNFAKYLDCLDAFFKQDCIASSMPAARSKDDLLKIGLLFNTIMRVSLYQYLEADNRSTLKLIANLSQCIFENFWENFDEDLAEDIVKVFTANKETSALLTEGRLKSDLYHIVNTININTKSAVRDERIAQLTTYLKNHHAVIATDHMAIMRPLFQMTLGGTHGDKENYLPRLDLFANLPVEKQITKQKDFWNFIAQRQPVEEKDVDQMAKLFSDSHDTEEFNTIIWNKLMELPPYVSIKYVNANLKGKISNTNMNDSKIAIKEITEASEAFTKFARQFGLITSDSKYSSKIPRIYAKFEKLFANWKPEESKLFFNFCAQKQYADVPLDLLAVLGKQWSKEGVDTLNEQLTLALDIQKLPFGERNPYAEAHYTKIKTDKSTASLHNFVMKANECANTLDSESLYRLWQWWEDPRAFQNHDALKHRFALAADIQNLSDINYSFYLNDFLKNLNKKDIVDKIQQFVNQAKGHSFDAPLLQKIWSLWINDDLTETEFNASMLYAKNTKNDAALVNTDPMPNFDSWLNNPARKANSLEQIFELLRDLALLDKKYPALKLSNKFLKEEDKEQTRQAYREFLQATNNKDIYQQTMIKLSSAWLAQRIPNVSTLQQLVSAVLMAQELNQKQNWSDYFAHFEKNKLQRQKIMQLISHNLLDLGVNFTEKCYNEYQKLALREIQPPESIQGNLMQRRTSLIMGYKKIAAFAQEIYSIHKGIQADLNTKPVLGSTKIHHTFFETCKKNYDKAWWKNKTRKSQANTLFSNLKNITTSNKNEFYTQSLYELWDTQQRILHSDRNTHRNSKGYSRLYDLTVLMSMNLMKTYIADVEIPMQEKDWLEDRISAQKEYFITTLAQRLPKKHEYKNLFGSYSESWKPGSSDWTLFEERLATVDIKKVPKHLQYLVTNIQCVISEPKGDNSYTHKISAMA